MCTACIDKQNYFTVMRKFVNMFSMAIVNIQIPESIAIFSKIVEILNIFKNITTYLPHMFGLCKNLYKFCTTSEQLNLSPWSILNSSAHFVTVLKLAVFELPTPLFVGRLRGGSSSVSLFILVLLFEKNEDIVDIFQTNGMQIFPKATHERTRT